MKLPMVLALIASVFSFLVAPAVCAADGAGIVLPKSIKVEGGRVFVFGDFSNPDKCATSSVVVLRAENPEELARMTAVVMTAVAANKKIGGWLSGCAPTNWYPSAPQMVSVDLYNQ